VITIILILICAVANAIMDLSSEDRFSKDWMNKTTGSRWCLGDKSKGEAFPFSSNILVAFTDLWHFSQLVFHTSWQLAIAIQFDKWIGVFLLIKITFSLLFEIVYSLLKKKLGE
jgi:hypothetical protein